LHSPICPQNQDSSTLISTLIASAVPSRSIVKFVALHREHSHVYRCALPVEKFPFLILLISRNNSQSFVPGYRRISSHGLIVYEHSSIHSAAPNQISHQIRNVCLAITPAVLRPHDPPATFVLRANVSAQQRGAHHDYCQYCRTLN
jgi:hypothetical protein